MQSLALVLAAVLVQKSAVVLALEQLSALALAVLSAADEPDEIFSVVLLAVLQRVLVLELPVALPEIPIQRKPLDLQWSAAVPLLRFSGAIPALRLPFQKHPAAPSLQLAATIPVKPQQILPLPAVLLALAVLVLAQPVAALLLVLLVQASAASLLHPVRVAFLELVFPVLPNWSAERLLLPFAEQIFSESAVLLRKYPQKTDYKQRIPPAVELPAAVIPATPPVKVLFLVSERAAAVLAASAAVQNVLAAAVELAWVLAEQFLHAAAPFFDGVPAGCVVQGNAYHLERKNSNSFFS